MDKSRWYAEGDFCRWGLKVWGSWKDSSAKMLRTVHVLDGKEMQLKRFDDWASNIFMRSVRK